MFYRRLTPLPSLQQAAVFRSENIRLQDEYHSVKSKLSAALDAQQDLLKKNHDLQQDAADMQGEISALHEDLDNKDSMCSSLQVGAAASITLPLASSDTGAH